MDIKRDYDISGLEQRVQESKPGVVGNIGDVLGTLGNTLYQMKQIDEQEKTREEQRNRQAIQDITTLTQLPFVVADSEIIKQKPDNYFCK